MGQSLLQRLGSDNRSIFILGVFLLFLIIGWFVPSFIIDQNNTLKVLLIMLASLAGGRLPAIMTGMELGVRNLTIVSVLFFCNLCWLLLMFPLIRSFYDNVVQVKVVGRLLHSAKERAIQGSRRVSSVGIYALPIFVWLPFPFTGSLVGAVIGHIIGIPTTKLLVLVVTAMCAGIFSWTFGLEYLVYLTGTTGKVICYSAIVIGLIYALIWRGPTKKKSEGNP
jgi:uncharacterized membrane protein